MNRRSIGLVAVIVAALGAVLVSMMWATSALQGPTVRMMDDRGGMMGYSSTTNEMGMRGGPMMGGPMMMGSGYGVAGTGPVATLEQARDAAERYADRLGGGRVSATGSRVPIVRRWGAAEEDPA